MTATADTRDGKPDRIDATLVRLLIVMVVGGMMAFLDATIVNVGIETFRTELRIGLDTAHWIATGYLLALAFVTPLAGWAMDRFGGKRVWLFALTVFVAGSVLCSLARSAESLITFRVVQGLGGGLLEPIMLAVLVRAAGPARVGRLMGLLGAIMIGPALGPVVGGVVLEYLPWQWLFLINVPIGAVAIVLAVRYLPADDGSGGVAQRVDMRGMALLCPGAAALMYGLSQLGEVGFGETRVVLAVVVGAALIAGYLVHAFTSAEPLVDPRLFRHRTFTASALGMVLLGVTLFGLLFLIPLYYQEVRDYGLLTVGLLLMPLVLGALVGNLVAGRLSDRHGARRLAPTGAALIAAATVTFAVAGRETPLVLLVVAALAAGFGVGFVGAPTMGALYRTVPDDRVPRATSAALMLNQLGAASGIALIATVLRHSSAHASAFWWVCGAAVVIFVVGFALPGPARPVTTSRS